MLDGGLAGLDGMLEMPVIPFGGDMIPAVVLQHFDDFPAVHIYYIHTFYTLCQE